MSILLDGDNGETLPGNLIFTGTGNRIRADFSNDTISSRLAFQSSTVDGATIFNLIPNGTSNHSAFWAFANSVDQANSSIAAFGLDSTGAEVTIRAARTGTGAYLPLTFRTFNTERMRIESDAAARIKTVGSVYAERQTATSGNIDLAAGNNFTVLTTGATTLTPSNFKDGQTGMILISNTGGHAISKASGLIWSDPNFLTTVSSQGVYLVYYLSLSNAIRVSYSQNTQNLG
jgi:hypothetical protein